MTDPLALTCGCAASIVDNVLIFQPCSVDCPNYLRVLTESAEADVPVRHTRPEEN
jgi:hypothetical protein